MKEQKKYSLAPTVFGCIMSVLLVISFFLPRIWKNNLSVEAFNTVLIISILCIAVHVIRITSTLYFEHVWKSITFTILLLIPVLYLIVIAMQFIIGNPEFLQNIVSRVFLIIISLPALCCYYFTAIYFRYRDSKVLRIGVFVIDVVGVLYCMVRLADKVFLPLGLNGGNELQPVIDNLDKISPYFSLIVYALAFFNFIICAKLFNSVADKNSSNEEIE